MDSTAPDEGGLGRLRRQRNLFAALTACLLASIALALPRRVASHRELAALNARLVELQATIIGRQQQILATEGQILAAQQEIRRLEAK
jgi:hypothetical protein